MSYFIKKEKNRAGPTQWDPFHSIVAYLDTLFLA